MMVTTTTSMLSATATTCVNEYGYKCRQKSQFEQGIHIFNNSYVIKTFEETKIHAHTQNVSSVFRIEMAQMKKKANTIYFHYKSNKRFSNIHNSDD